MKRYTNPQRSQWDEIVTRPAIDTATLDARIATVLDAVRARGDDALREYTLQFDGVRVDSFAVPPEEIEAAGGSIEPALRSAIEQAAANIRKFHSAQLEKEQVVETMPGVECWRRSVGIEKIGLYIPGGSAPLFSTVLMLGIPAKLAGCREIVLCSPPGKDGKLSAPLLFAAQLSGITQIFRVGGAQAIGAMAYGTASIPRVYKIFGPGNQYVTAAKQSVQQQGTAIDMPAGPSEVCVLADETADARFVAADLLSQAEHGPDSQVLLVTLSAKLADEVVREVGIQLEQLPRKEIAASALQNSRVVVMNSPEEALALVNAYAPEHLIISCAGAEKIGDAVLNAGSVFLGNYSPESVGDYASGTNHTLPTNGYARAYSGVSVDSFVKKITYQRLTREGLKSIAATVQVMAEGEGLQAHANAVKMRL